MNHVADKMIHASEASSGEVRYAYGNVKYPLMPQFDPQELRIKKLYVFGSMNHDYFECTDFTQVRPLLTGPEGA